MERLPLTGDRRRILVWMCVLIAVNQLGFGALIPVAPLYAESYGVSQTAIGLTIAVYGLARFLLNVPAGQLADGRGRRWALAVGGLVTIVGNLLCAVAPTYLLFLGGRFIAGAGASMVLTGGQIVLADITSPHNRGRVMAIYQGVFLFSVGAGALPGGALAEWLGLAAPFVAYAVLAAVVTALAWLAVPETRGLPTEGSRERSEEPRGPQTGVSGERAAAPPLLRTQLRLLSATPGFLQISIVSFASSFARTGALFAIIPLLAAAKMGLDAGQIGVGLGLISIVTLVVVYPAGVLVDRVGRKAVIVPSTLLTGGSMVLFSVAPDYGWYLLACGFWSAASGIGIAAFAAYAADVAPAGMVASALGTYRTVADLGYVAGPLVLGVVADLGTPEAALWLTAAMLTVSSLSFARRAPETGRLVS